MTFQVIGRILNNNDLISKKKIEKPAIDEK